MKNYEYTTMFLELLRYISSLMDEKAKVESFFSGLQLEFRDQIEYDESQSHEDVIGKLKFFYEQSKNNTKSQDGWKGKDKYKGKWKPKRVRPQNAEDNKNVSPNNNFNVVRQGHGSQQHNRGDDRRRLQCWTCVKGHNKRYCSQNQGGRPELNCTGSIDCWGCWEKHSLGLCSIG